MQHPQPVPVLVGCDIAEPERLAPGVVVEGVERVEDHVPVVGEVVVREDTAVPVVLIVERSDADIAADTQDAGPAVGVRSVVIGLEDICDIDQLFPSIEYLMEEILPLLGIAAVHAVEPREQL